jgi:hypothetical protein
MRLQDRARTVWQRLSAILACTDIAKQLRERHSHFPSAKECELSQ